jgi:hypothetical protein
MASSKNGMRWHSCRSDERQAAHDAGCAAANQGQGLFPFRDRDETGIDPGQRSARMTPVSSPAAEYLAGLTSQLLIPDTARRNRMSTRKQCSVLTLVAQLAAVDNAPLNF